MTLSSTKSVCSPLSLSISLSELLHIRGKFYWRHCFQIDKKKDGNWDRRHRLFHLAFSLHKPDTPLCLLFEYSMNIWLMCDILALDLIGVLVRWNRLLLPCLEHVSSFVFSLLFS